MADTVVYAEQTLTLYRNGDYAYKDFDPAPFTLEKGETYRVVLDGVEYKLVCSPNYEIKYTIEDEYSNPDSGSFYICYFPEELGGPPWGVITIAVWGESDTHTIAIYQKEKAITYTVPSAALKAVADAIRAKTGGTSVLTLDQMATEIAGIETGITPSGTRSIVENGVYNVKEYETAEVSVPQPSGSVVITENGTHDVSGYAAAVVNVPVGVFPSGTKSITANGAHDVTNYASVSVNVPTETVEEYDGTVTVSGAVSLISFTIDGTSYQAEEGMTWGEWVESDYNTGPWVASGGYITDGGMVKILKDGSYARTTTLIIADAAYTLSHSGGSDT